MKSEKAVSSSMIFQTNQVAFRLFFALLLTTEAMGIWRFAGAFTVVFRQIESGSKTTGMHFSRQLPIGVC